MINEDDYRVTPVSHNPDLYLPLLLLCLAERKTRDVGVLAYGVNFLCLPGVRLPDRGLAGAGWPSLPGPLGGVCTLSDMALDCHWLSNRSLEEL